MKLSPDLRLAERRGAGASFHAVDWGTANYRRAAPVFKVVSVSCARRSQEQTFDFYTSHLFISFLLGSFSKPLRFQRKHRLVAEVSRVENKTLLLLQRLV